MYEESERFYLDLVLLLLLIIPNAPDMNEFLSHFHFFFLLLIFSIEENV